jgi:hypothetical protein
MEKKLNLFQKLKPIQDKLKDAKARSNDVRYRKNVKDPLYWMSKVKEYEKEIEETIKNHKI